MYIFNELPGTVFTLTESFVCWIFIYSHLKLPFKQKLNETLIIIKNVAKKLEII
jgi:hypothetical protein